MTDDLDTILNEALTDGTVFKTADLVNLTVTITAFGPPHDNTFPAEYDASGKETKPARTSRSYKATIIFDGQTEPVAAWMGGGWMTPQIEALIARDRLPCRVKVIRDTTKDGNPYVLVSGGAQPVSASQNVENAVAAVHAAPPPAASGKTPVQRCLDAFYAKALALQDDLQLANIIGTRGAGEALIYLPTGQLSLDPGALSALPVTTIIQLTEALE